MARLGAAAAARTPASTGPALAADHDRIRDRIEAVIPGFERYNERVRDRRRVRAARTRRATSARSRPPTRQGPLHRQPARGASTCPTGRLLLQTVRSHDQFNTTIYGLDDRYRGIQAGRRVVFVHPDDLAALGFADAEVVDVVSHFADGVERRAEAFRLVAYPVARGTCAAYFPEANVLVPLGSTAEGSGTPTSKSVVVSFERGAQLVELADVLQEDLALRRLVEVGDVAEVVRAARAAPRCGASRCRRSPGRRPSARAPRRRRPPRTG